MQCSSCGAPNKDEAKFCAECGKPLVSGSDEEQVERLVEYLTYYEYDYDAPPKEDELRRMREAARAVHAKWKANPRVEDVKVEITEDKIEQELDSEDLLDIFSGRDAAGRADEMRERAEDAAREKAEAEERERKEEEKRERKQQEEMRSFKVNGAIIAVIVAGVIGGGIIEERKKHKEHEEDVPAGKHETHRAADTTPATATTSTVPPVEVPVPIASCTCVSRATGKNTFALERPAVGGPWHVKWDHISGFTSMKSGFWLGDSDAGAATAIPRGTTQLQAVMACENEIVAVVAGDVASAWTGTDSGELLWTRKLPAPYAFPKDAGLGDNACAPALGVTGNVFTVPLAKGKTIALSIRDGSVQK